MKLGNRIDFSRFIHLSPTTRFYTLYEYIEQFIDLSIVYDIKVAMYSCIFKDYIL